nr:MAG TPA: hypothetical protein [Caudoviricetes sp.]
MNNKLQLTLAAILIIPVSYILGKVIGFNVAVAIDEYRHSK